MPRFFINPNTIQKDTVRLSEEESHHAVDVFRLKKGDAVDLFDGKGTAYSR